MGIESKFQLLGVFLQGQVASLSPSLAAVGIDPGCSVLSDSLLQEEYQCTVLQQV